MMRGVAGDAAYNLWPCHTCHAQTCCTLSKVHEHYNMVWSKIRFHSGSGDTWKMKLSIMHLTAAE